MPSICSPDDVLIQVKSGSVDPIDIKICNGYARVLRKQLNKYNPVRFILKVIIIVIHIDSQKSSHYIVFTKRTNYEWHFH
jgi:hypothetical protein